MVTKWNIVTAKKQSLTLSVLSGLQQKMLFLKKTNVLFDMSRLSVL